MNECHKTHKTFYNVESATKFILTTELMSLFFKVLVSMAQKCSCVLSSSFSSPLFFRPHYTTTTFIAWMYILSFLFPNICKMLVSVFITRCTLHSQCYMLSTQLMRVSIPSCSIFCALFACSQLLALLCFTHSM